MQNKKIPILMFLLVVQGCSMVNTKESFVDVQMMTVDKLGSKIIWNQDEESAKEIDLAINDLLAKTLTVSDAVRIALLNNQEIQAIYQELGIAQSDLVQAGLLRNPLFDIERRFSGKAFEFGIAQDFIDLFFIPLRTRVAENVLEVTKKRIAAEVIQHAAKTKVAFYELQAQLQKLEMLGNVSRVMDASAFAAKKIFQAGNIIELEMRNEESLALEAKIDLALIENEVIQKREHLNVLMGLWGKNTAWRIEKRLPNPPPADPAGRELERLAISERLDLAAERDELNALGSKINLSGYGAMLSEVMIGFRSERESGGDTTRGPSLQIPIPIFNQGTPAKARAQAIFQQKAARFAQHAIEIRSDVRATFNKMRASRQRAEFLQKEVLPLKARILEQTQLQYNGMFMSVFQLLQAKRSQIETGKAFIAALEDYWVSRTQLELAVGGRIESVPIVTQELIDQEVVNKKRKPSSHSHHHHH